MLYLFNTGQGGTFVFWDLFPPGHISVSEKETWRLTSAAGPRTLRVSAFIYMTKRIKGRELKQLQFLNKGKSGIINVIVACYKVAGVISMAKKHQLS